MQVESVLTWRYEEEVDAHPNEVITPYICRTSACIQHEGVNLCGPLHPSVAKPTGVISATWTDVSDIEKDSEKGQLARKLNNHAVPVLRLVMTTRWLKGAISLATRRKVQMSVDVSNHRIHPSILTI